MSTPTFFTVEADYRAVVAYRARSPFDPELDSVTASVIFTPILNSGDVILATQAVPRPTGFVPVPIQAQIGEDGRLGMRASVDTPNIPVRLLANSPLLELKSPLYYRVSFSNVKFGKGKDQTPGSISPFVFEAPNADVVVNLIGVQRQPGQPASGIIKIAPTAARVTDGKVQFSFNGVDIPDALDLGDIRGAAGDKGDKGDPGEPAVAPVTGESSGAPTPLVVWVGTASEYAAIQQKVDTTVYVVRP